MKGLEGFAGGVVAGVGADAVPVELAFHRAEDRAEHQPDLPLVQVLHDLDQDRGRGVVDVPDSGPVGDQPAQRAAVGGQDGDVPGEPGRVGVVQAGAEPVDRQTPARCGPLP